MTDEEILLKYKIAESRDMAFKALVVKYQQRLYFHIRRMVIDHDDANDVLQNTFIKAWKGLENFREESQLYTWLYRIGTNECLTFLAQKQRKFSYSLDELQNHLSNKLTADNQFDGNQLETKLQKAILTLPDKQRLVFNLRYYDEMPYEEMSNVLGTSEGALKASYHHAVKKIEAIIKNTD
jgi:RNA polymerase sigma-70 factor (ECF subfamily)